MHATRSSKLRVYSQPLRGSFAAFEVHRAAEIAGNIAHEICGRNGIWNFSAHLLHVLDDAFLGVGVVDLPTFVRILLLLSTLLGGGRGGRLLLFLLLSTLLGGGGGRPRRLLSTLRGGPATTAVCALAGRNCSGNSNLRDSTSSLAAVSEECGGAPFDRRASMVSAAGRAARGQHTPPRRARR